MKEKGPIKLGDERYYRLNRVDVAAYSNGISVWRRQKNGMAYHFPIQLDPLHIYFRANPKVVEIYSPHYQYSVFKNWKLKGDTVVMSDPIAVLGKNERTEYEIEYWTKYPPTWILKGDKLVSVVTVSVEEANYELTTTTEYDCIYSFDEKGLWYDHYRIELTGDCAIGYRLLESE